MSRMTASLTAGSWCQNEGELKEEKSSLSRRFLFIIIFLSEKQGGAALFTQGHVLEKSISAWWTEKDYFDYIWDLKLKAVVNESKTWAQHLHCLYLVFRFTELNSRESGVFATWDF